MMPSASYALRSRWELPLHRDALWSVVEEALNSDDPLPWWGLVEVAGRDPEALHLIAHSGLGYRLRFSIDQVRLDPPHTMEFRVRGDLVGHALLRFVPAGRSRSVVLIDWHVHSTRAWMRWSDPLLRPVFTAAHALVMRRGEQRLRRWLSAGPSRLSR